MTYRSMQQEVMRSELLQDVADRAAQIVAVYLPDAPDDVREQIGNAIADDMATYWGGQQIQIPMDYHYRLAARDRALLQDHDAGMLSTAIARKYRMSYRHVQRVIKRGIQRRQADASPIKSAPTRPASPVLVI